MKTLLIVDDNPDNRDLCIEILEGDYILIEAADGEEALHMARTGGPHLILLDMGLPKKSGFQVAQELKADPDYRHIPIIALTAHAMAGDKEKTLSAGCDAYLSKPLTPSELCRLIEELLGEE